MSNGTVQHPRTDPTDPTQQQAPIELPSHDDGGVPREAPERSDPDEPAIPPSREPGPPPTSGSGPQVDIEGIDDAPAVDQEEAHVGATEEQIGDRTGPGVGYDQAETPK